MRFGLTGYVLMFLFQQNSMIFEKEPVTVTEDASFHDVLDSACERLWNKHTQYSIRRIQEMGEELDRLEKELDQFLNLSFSTKMTFEK